MGRIDGCKSNPKKSSTTKVIEHIPSGFSLFTISSFKGIENKHDTYGVKNFMKKFRESLRKRAMEAISFKRKKCYY